MISVKYMMQFLKDEKLFKYALFLMLCAIVLMISQPYLISLVIKAAIEENATAASFVQSFAIYAFVAFFINIIVLFDILTTNKIVTKLTKKSNRFLFLKISEKHIDFISTNSSGNISSKITSVSNALKQFYLTIFHGIILEGLLYIGFISYICYTVPIAGFTVLFLTFIYIIIALTYGKRVKITQKEFTESKNVLSGFIVDSISNILLMKAFSNVESEDRSLYPLNRYNYKKARKYGQVKAIYGFFTRVLMLSNTVIVVGLGGYLLFTNSITADIFVGCYSAVIMLNVRLRFLIIGIENYFDTSGIIDNGLDLLLSENKVLDKHGAKVLEFNNSDIEFENVCFKYNDTPVLNNFNLDIKNGQTTALIGKSGAGKSTIVNLLQRFYDISEGSLKFEGVDIRDLNQESLRANISYIPQEPSLFSRTIFDNISYGQTNATMDDVIEAAKLANAHEFIMKLPNGYDEVVGERGFKLSGGQKQRIAIARAILKDAPIVIMDEATSALDSHSEKLIQESMKSLLNGKTCIVIAHRLSTIKSADRVIVIDEGKIMQDGTHKQLLAEEGIYKELWDLQQDGFIS